MSVYVGELQDMVECHVGHTSYFSKYLNGEYVSGELAPEASTVYALSSNRNRAFSSGPTPAVFLLAGSCWTHMSSLRLSPVIGRVACQSYIPHLLLGRLFDASHSGSKYT